MGRVVLESWLTADATNWHLQYPSLIGRHFLSRIRQFLDIPVALSYWINDFSSL
jgi:hypothetical protein